MEQASKTDEAVRSKKRNSNDAAEVAHHYDAPIPVLDARDGLHSAAVEYQTEKSVLAPTVATHYSAPREGPVPAAPARTRSWLWIVGAVVAGLVGLGVGMGIGYAARLGHDGAVCTPTGSSTSPIAPGSSNDITSSTPTTSAITSGTTGIADLTCNGTAPSNTYTSTPDPSQAYKFIQECYTTYRKDHPNNNNTGDVTNLAAKVTYTFQACMDQCAMYNGINNRNATQPCLAVSYVANVTYGVENHDGNCWLKTARGERTPPTVYQDLFASAYLASQPFE